MSTSRSVNKVILIGNLTRNPVLRTIGNGSVVCNFGIATNATWKDGGSNVQERTEFHNLVAWNKLAEICAQILAVGMLIYVEGELRTRTWDDANGVRHYKTEIKINDMKLLDDKGKKGVGLDEAKLAGEEEGEVPTETQASEPEALEVIAEEEVKKPKEDLEKADDGEDLF
jgi:single-strand DNA-binding protein